MCQVDQSGRSGWRPSQLHRTCGQEHIGIGGRGLRKVRVTGGDVAAAGGPHLGTPDRQPARGSARRTTDALLCARPLWPGVREKLRPLRSSHIVLDVAFRRTRSRSSVAVVRYPYVSGPVDGNAIGLTSGIVSSDKGAGGAHFRNTVALRTRSYSIPIRHPDVSGGVYGYDFRKTSPYVGADDFAGGAQFCDVAVTGRRSRGSISLIHHPDVSAWINGYAVLMHSRNVGTDKAAGGAQLRDIALTRRRSRGSRSFGGRAPVRHPYVSGFV